MLQLLLFGCIVFPLIAAVAVALDKEGTLRRRIVYAGTGITALSALGLALYGSFVLPISPDSSLQPLMTVLDLALLVFILYVAVNIRHRLSMGLALGQLADMIYLDFFMLEGHQATAFLADPLALVMVLVISLVGGIVCIFGLGYMQEHEDHLRLAKSKQSRFFFFLLLFLGAMNGLVLCDSLTWVFFFWEITTLCSFFLISHDGTREAKRNATRALWMNMVGGIGFLAAMLFMQKAIGTLSIQAMLAQSVVMHSTAAMLPVAFLCFAAFTKSAQLPFQSWLCGAMVAPTPVSALLHSYTMVKAGVYLVLRLSPAFAGTMLAGIVSLTGAFTFVAASALACGQSNGKKILAYSTIANLGLIIACAGMATPAAITAAILDCKNSGVDMVLCTGGMSVDPDDRTPGAIKATGASIVSYGSPVLPGAMFLLGYFDDGTPVMGLPGCVMYAKATIFDLILPRVCAKVPVTRKDLAMLGHGGLCLGCKECHYPICPFGKA